MAPVANRQGAPRNLGNYQPRRLFNDVENEPVNANQLAAQLQGLHLPPAQCLGPQNPPGPQPG